MTTNSIISESGSLPFANASREKQEAAIALLNTLVQAEKPDWTSRVYKKYVRVIRQGRIMTARKCAIKMGVPPATIDAAFTLLEG